MSIRLSVCLGSSGGLATGKGTTLPVGKAAARFPQQQPNALSLSFSSRRISWPPIVCHCRRRCMIPSCLAAALRIYLGVIGSRRSSELYHFQAELLCGSALIGAQLGTDIILHRFCDTMLVDDIRKVPCNKTFCIFHTSREEQLFYWWNITL